MREDLSQLNELQIDKLSDICSDVALVSLASVVLPAVFDKGDPIQVSLGLVIALAFWSLSLWLRK